MKEISQKTLEKIKSVIEEEIKTIDKIPYSDSIISLNLQMANDEFGEKVKNDLIDEFNLEKRGWNKKSKEIKRMGIYDLQTF